MWRNIWPILLLGAFGYAFYTGWNPLAGWLPVPAYSLGRQAGAARRWCGRWSRCRRHSKKCPT